MRHASGFAICQDKSGQLARRAAAAGITVEVCLPICMNPRFTWYTSGGDNIYAKHPIKEWTREFGLAATLSCDNITLSGTRAISTSGMLTHLLVDLDFSWKETREILLNGVKGAFVADGEAKERLVEDFAAELDEALLNHGIDIAAAVQTVQASVQ